MVRVTGLDRFDRTATRVRWAGPARDPSAATQQVRYLGRAQPMVPEWDAETAVRKGYNESWVVARCVEIIARDVARVPFVAGADSAKPADVNPKALLARLLGPPPGGPGPKLTARRLWWWWVAQRLVTGRLAAEIESAAPGGPPVALWPLVSAFLTAYPSAGGVDYWDRFTYGRPDQVRPLRTDQVFYDWIPSLDDFRQPYSPLQSARLDTSISVMIGRQTYSFMAGGAVPATVVITDQFADQAAKARFEHKWNATHQGVDRAGSTAFIEATDDSDAPLSEAIHIEQLGMSAKDSKAIEAERESLEHVAMALGVPWSRLSAAGRTYDNAAAEDEAYWESTILPILNDLGDAVNLQLAERCGTDMGWFDLSGIRVLQTKPSKATAAVGAPSMVQAQLMTIDEGRADYQLPPLPNGAGARLMTVDEIVALRGATGPAEPVRQAKPVERPARAVRDTGEDVEQRRARIWKAVDAQAQVLEGRWVKALTRLFARQQRSVVQALEGKRGAKLLRGPAPQFDPTAVFNPDYWTDESKAVVQDLYEAVAAQGFARVAEQFAIAFDLGTDEAQEFIQTRSNKLAGQITDTTYQAIKDELSDGVAAGETIPELVDRIGRVFDVATDARAETIARTEVISAFNGASWLAAAQAPPDVVGGQQWIATRDGRTRPEHADADGQTVGVDEPFDIDGEPLMYPGDPNGSAAMTVNCRCTAAILSPAEYEAETGGRGGGRVMSLRAARQIVDLAHRGKATA